MILIPISKNKKIVVYKSLIVFIIISAQVIVMQLITQEINAKVYTCIILSCLCFFEIYSDSKIKPLFYTQIVISSVGILLAWLNLFSPLPKELALLDYIFFTLFYFLATCTTVYKVSNCFKLNKDTIINAINGYLYLGLLGAFLATSISIHNYDAFKFTNNITHTHVAGQFVYYSFVTLTTVGYGDIVPFSNSAKVLTIFLCVSGQLYLTIIIGIIIGKYVSKVSINSKK